MDLKTFFSLCPNRAKLQQTCKNFEDNTTAIQVRAIELFGFNFYKDSFILLCTLSYLDSIEFDSNFIENCEKYIYPQWKASYEKEGKGISYLKLFLYAYISGAYPSEEDHVYSAKVCLTLFYLIIEAEGKTENFLKEMDFSNQLNTYQK